MSNRTKALWVPGLISLIATMGWRLILEATVRPADALLNHAGLTLHQELLWLVALPLIGAASAYFSRRAGGDRLTVLGAVLLPSIVMIPLWTVLAMKMAYPSASQWFGLFSGVLNWIIAPGVALLLGAIPFLQVRGRIWWKPCMNIRTRILWAPSLVSLTGAMGILSISTLIGLQTRFVARGVAPLVIYIPWLLFLPVCGAAGGHLSRRSGGTRLACFFAALFPVIVISILVGFLTLTGKFSFAEPRWRYLSIAVLLGCIVPGAMLVLGAAPFTKRPRLANSGWGEI